MTATMTRPAGMWTDAAADETAFENRMAEDDTRDRLRALQALADEFVAVAEAMVGPALADPVTSRGYARIVRYYHALLLSDITTPPLDLVDFLIWCAAGMPNIDDLEA